MVLVKSKPKKMHAKHHMHHRMSRQYANVYYPYLPIISILTIASLWSFIAPKNFQQRVLGKAISISQDSLLASTNNERLENQQPPLTLNTELSRAAQAKAQDMAVRNYWSHNTPDGTPPWKFIEATSYTYQKAGENLAYGFIDSQTTVEAWMQSPGHKANILDSAFQEVGFGFTDSEDFNNGGPSTIVVAMYGRPLVSVPTPSPVTRQPEAVVEPPTTQVASEQLDKSARSLSMAQLVSSKGSYIAIASIILMSISMGVWAGSHLNQIKRVVRRGEALVLHHPLLDIVMLSSVLLSVIANQTAGFIR